MWIERGYTDFMKVNSSLEEFIEIKAKLIFQQIIISKKVF
jgi:hypothetical protein